MRLSPQSQPHKLNYKLGLSNCQLLGQLTEQEVVQTFCLSDLQYYHYHLQDLSYLIVQHQQNCGSFYFYTSALAQRKGEWFTFDRN